jgi:rhomboid-like protein
LGRIDVKKIPITDRESNFALNEDILHETHHPDSTSNRKPVIWKPFIFFVGVSILGLGLAVDQTNRDTAQKIEHIREHQGTFPGWFSKTFTGYASYLDPSDSQLQQLRKLEKLNFIKEYGLNNIFPNHLLTWYINLGEGKQICCILALINLQIFALWQMPRLVKSMTQRFTHFPLSGKSYTMITSTFSHSVKRHDNNPFTCNLYWIWLIVFLFPQSALHFGFNMLALYSIGSTAHDFLTHRLRAARDVDPVRIPESTPTYHFLAFYIFGALNHCYKQQFQQIKLLMTPALINPVRLLAGLAASFGSHAYSLLIRAPRLLKWRQGLSKGTSPPSPILPSLGASGAIYGCLSELSY